MTYELYTDRAGKFRWRLIADNGRILAVSSESYIRKIDCRKCLELTKCSMNVPVKVLRPD